MRLLDDPVAFFGGDAIQDPYPLYDRLRAEGPVHRVGESGFYLVCDWGAINDAVNRPDEFSSNLTATMTFGADGTVVPFELDQLGGPTQILATADDPAHALHRKLLVPQLAAKKIRSMEVFIEQTFDRLWIDGLRDGRIEWMSALANKLPMMVVARLIGVPAEDVDKLIRWAGASTQLLDGLVDQEKLTASGIAAMELGNYIRGHFVDAAADPPDNLLGALASACNAGEFEQLTAQLMMIILFSAGGESTGSLLGNAMEILAARPHIQRQVREDPGLLGPFIEEALRYEPPFRGHYRHVVRATSLAGTELPAGSRLLLLWGAANRDPATFDAPDEFRLDRPGGKGHITFGKGVHFCVGAALARLEAQIVLREVLDRTSWIGVVDAGPWLPSVLVRRREHLRLRVGRESPVET
ncbi:cytochrome [Mycobacterium sp. ACS1612]|uniref:cytochrome P450 n=1 Tax=Mycobacterium sp. ACS1612 TaxID=1834117 RepID=UPI0007FD250C|nr:cytochrome P450 [Mycobacterium sp. ACS1612]OBF29284.1 cytochrome [Mycobacterium sp. ACS1612]